MPVFWRCQGPNLEHSECRVCLLSHWAAAKSPTHASLLWHTLMLLRSSRFFFLKKTAFDGPNMPPPPSQFPGRLSEMVLCYANDFWKALMRFHSGECQQMPGDAHHPWMPYIRGKFGDREWVAPFAFSSYVALISPV